MMDEQAGRTFLITGANTGSAAPPRRRWLPAAPRCTWPAAARPRPGRSAIEIAAATGNDNLPRASSRAPRPLCVDELIPNYDAVLPHACAPRLHEQLRVEVANVLHFEELAAAEGVGDLPAAPGHDCPRCAARSAGPIRSCSSCGCSRGGRAELLVLRDLARRGRRHGLLRRLLALEPLPRDRRPPPELWERSVAGRPPAARRRWGSCDPGAMGSSTAASAPRSPARRTESSGGSSITGAHTSHSRSICSERVNSRRSRSITSCSSPTVGSGLVLAVEGLLDVKRERGATQVEHRSGPRPGA